MRRDTREYNREYMRNGRRYNDNYAYDNRRYEYNYGSAARRLDEYEEKESGRNTRHDARPEAAAEPKAKRLNLSMVALFVACFAAMSVLLVSYIGLQYEVSAATREVASLEKQLTAQKMRNDELLSDVYKSINIDEIKYTAIAKLGMTYAEEDQIIAYENKVEDYVHQVAEIDN